MGTAAVGPPAELRDWPAFMPGEFQLADLELLLAGAFRPLTGFMSVADAASVRRFGALCDGTPFPFPVTLEVPARAVPPGAARLVLADPEGAPLAVLDITERAPVGAGGPVRLAGGVRALQPAEHGPFRRLRRGPAEIRADLRADGPARRDRVVACATRAPLHARALAQLRELAERLDARVLLLPLIAGPAEVVVQPEALVRAVLAALPQLPPGTLVVPVPLAPRGPDGARDEIVARALVAAAYGATHLVETAAGASGASLAGSKIPVIVPGEWGYDQTAGRWRPAGRIEPAERLAELTPAELLDVLDRGGAIPGWFTPVAVARELRAARPPRHERGLVIFFTGLSGAGKSTLARDVADALAERGDRTVSLLDGDRVRHLLSAGLGFSRADRDLNIARIGYVAAEIARHGGVAICAPIAPYAAARAQARQMAAQTGDFLLVHVSTPLKVCEERDRKGLYAKARAGAITAFTGVSDPYEEPDDADLSLDTSVVTREEAAGAVLRLLTSGGWLA